MQEELEFDRDGTRASFGPWTPSTSRGLLLEWNRMSRGTSHTNYDEERRTTQSIGSIPSLRRSRDWYFGKPSSTLYESMPPGRLVKVDKRNLDDTESEAPALPFPKTNCFRSERAIAC